MNRHLKLQHSQLAKWVCAITAGAASVTEERRDLDDHELPRHKGQIRQVPNAANIWKRRDLHGTAVHQYRSMAPSRFQLLV